MGTTVLKFQFGTSQTPQIAAQKLYVNGTISNAHIIIHMQYIVPNFGKIQCLTLHNVGEGSEPRATHENFIVPFEYLMKSKENFIMPNTALLNCSE